MNNDQTENSTTDSVAEENSRAAELSPQAVDAIWSQLKSRKAKELREVTKLGKRARAAIRSCEESVANLVSKDSEIRGSLVSIEQAKSRISAIENEFKTGQGAASVCLTAIEKAASDATDKLSDVEEMHRKFSEIQASADAASDRCRHIHEGDEYVQGVVPKIKSQVQELEERTDTVVESVGYIESARKQVETLSSEVGKIRASAQSDRSAVQRLVDDLERLSTTVSEGSAKLSELQNRAESLSAQIEQLLPGATSTGLAQAFEKGQKSHVGQQNAWDVVSVISIIAIVVMGLVFYAQHKHMLESRDTAWWSLLTYMALNLPVAFGLVWLALHSGRRAAELRRVREDYAYKAALAVSFEGYKREMIAIGDALPGDHPVRMLCANTLGAMAMPPGRLYDAKYQDSTPLSLVSDAVDKAIGGKAATVRSGAIDVKLESVPQFIKSNDTK